MRRIGKTIAQASEEEVEPSSDDDDDDVETQRSTAGGLELSIARHFAGLKYIVEEYPEEYVRAEVLQALRLGS